MEYKKLKQSNITIHSIESNRFKEVSIVLFFTKKADVKDIAFSNLLCGNLIYSSKKYNTRSKIATKGEDLFGSKVGASFGIEGNISNIIISLDMLNPLYSDDEFTNDAIDYLCEVLFNPNIVDNHFYQDYFDIIKKDYISSIKAIKDNPGKFASIKFCENMFKNTILARQVPTIEEVENVNSTNLYEFYKKLFNGDYKIDIAIYGEKIDNIISIVKDRFKDLISNKEKLTLKIKDDNKPNAKEIIDSLNYNQSRLYIGYKIKNANYHDITHILKVYNVILGSMNDSMLFNYVREKYSLCYSIGSFFNKYDPSLMIYAGINKDNYEESKQRIFEVMDMMKDKSEVNKLFKEAKETLNTYINSYYDDVTSQINHYYFKEFDNIEEIEELRENFNKVTIDEIIEFNNKLELNTIYLMKGEENGN